MYETANGHNRELNFEAPDPSLWFHSATGFQLTANKSNVQYGEFTVVGSTERSITGEER